MEKEKYGVLMIDVSNDILQRRKDTLTALETIITAYPEMTGHIYSFWENECGKYARIAEVIKTFDYADILYCNTCGDEIDHLYRFVRAIAHAAGLEIIPVHDIKVGPDEQKEDKN